MKQVSRINQQTAEQIFTMMGTSGIVGKQDTKWGIEIKKSNERNKKNGSEVMYNMEIEGH